MTIKNIVGIFKHLSRLNTTFPSKIIKKQTLYLPPNNIMKVNYYLPLNKKEIVHNVTGIYNPPKDFYNIAFLNKNKELFIKMIIKYCFNVLNGKNRLNYTNLIQGIDDFLNQSVIFPETCYYVLCQHILVNALAKITIPPQYLLTNILKVNYKLYSNINITINRIIEHIVLAKTSGDLITSNNLEVIAQNPDNPYSTENYNIEYFVKLSHKQLKQPYADYIVFFKHKLQTWDVKFITNTDLNFKLYKGHLTLMQTKYLSFFITKYLGEFEKKLKTLNDIDQTIWSEIYYNNLIDIKNDKKMSIEDKYIKFKAIQDKIDLTTPLISSKVASTMEDDAFNLFYQENATKIDQIVKYLITSLDLEIYIPKEGQKVFISEWKELIRNIIKLMPQNVRSNMENNLEALEILENTISENSTQNLCIEYKNEQNIIDDIIDKSIGKY